MLICNHVAIGSFTYRFVAYRMLAGGTMYRDRSRDVTVVSEDVAWATMLAVNHCSQKTGYLAVADPFHGIIRSGDTCFYIDIYSCISLS